MAKGSALISKAFLKQKSVATLPKEVQRGLKSLAVKQEAGGPASFAMWPFQAMFEKALGKKKVEDFMWNRFHRPIQDVNIAMGNKAHKFTSKVPGLRSLFLETQTIPVGSKGLKKDIRMPAFSAPVNKAMGLATPIVMGVALDRGINSLLGTREQTDTNFTTVY